MRYRHHSVQSVFHNIKSYIILAAMDCKYHQELWAEECQICVDPATDDMYFINQCACPHLVCRGCAYHISVVRDGHRFMRCPFCRHESDVTPSLNFEARRWTHSSFRRRTTCALNNWRYWFLTLNFGYFMRPYLLAWGVPTNVESAMRVLRTGRFDDPYDAGICENRLEARRYITRQMDRFMEDPDHFRPT